MVWQKVTGHIHGERIMVQNKSGKDYGADCSEHDASMVYTHSVNEKNDWELWAWVEFDEEPRCEYVCTGDPSGGPPKAPPWEL